MKHSSRKCIPQEHDFFGVLVSQDNTPEELYIEDEMKEYIKEICNELKDPYKKVALQHFIEEKSIKEIAQESSSKIKTIQTQVYRAKKLLQMKLGGNNNE